MREQQSLVKYLLLDLNSFFASCEQQDSVYLRGKAVAVVPMLAENTSVLASSVEAKKFGIKTGTKVYEARKLCPQVVFIEAQHRKYTEYHHKIVSAVNEICPVEKVLSIDEMVCELIGRERVPDTAVAIAEKIKLHLKEKVGERLTSSVGISTNILLAKMASDLIKPNGLVLVTSDKISSTFDHLSVQTIPGVGRNMREHLNRKGYQTVGQLRQLTATQMRALWGSIVGLRLSEELQGYDVKRKPTETKSLSHEHVLPPNLRNIKSACDILFKLATKACFRLRQTEQMCTSLSIVIRDQIDSSRFEKSVSFAETDDTFFILEQVKKMLIDANVIKPIKVSVVVSGLKSNSVKQLNLFADAKTQKLGHVMDLVNKKYGPNTLMPAGFLDVVDRAKTCIAFNHIPQVEDEFD